MVVPDQKPDAAPRRSRIVIDVGKDQQNSPAAGRARRTGGGGGGGGAGKVLIVIALVIVAIFAAVGVGGFLWYRGQKQTPAYSLALLADSAQRNDMQQFDRMVDLDRVAENFLPQVVERAGGDANSILSTVNNASGGANAAARMLPGVREAVRDEFVRQAREASAGGANVPVFLIALAVPRVVDSITEEANAARVNLKIQNRPVELTMERAEIEGEPRWRVVSVRDDELATRIAGQLQQGTLPRGLTDQLPEGLPNTDDLPLGRGGRNNNAGSNRNARRPSNSSPSPTPRRERQQGRNANDFLRDLPSLPIP